MIQAEIRRQEMNDKKILTYIAELFFLTVIAASLSYIFTVVLLLGIVGLVIDILMIYAYVNIAYYLDKKLKDDLLFTEKVPFTKKIVTVAPAAIPAAGLGCMIYWNFIFGLF